MAEWRFGRGWDERELLAHLSRLSDAPLNFDEPPDSLSTERGWRYYESRGDVALEAPGPPLPDGPFRRMVPAVAGYRFSDPDIVEAHFDPDAPLRGRTMLLELKPLGLRFLCGARVGAVRQRSGEHASVFGFRYDTLRGHVERGAEWFLLEKDHESGRVTFHIQAHWKPGDFPNWWSRLGFRFLAPRYQRRWHRRSHGRLARIAAEPPSTRGDRLAHEGPDLA